MGNREIIKIGGEFEINSELLNEFDIQSDVEVRLFSTGRSALMAILLDLKGIKKNKIHLPYYICHTVVEACFKVGYEVVFYELTDQFLFPLEYLEDINFNEVLLSVNYFGFVNDNELIFKIRSLRSDILIISDQVQSIWTVSDSIADYAFTSYRKHLSVTDGAIVYKNNKKFSVQDDAEINFFAQYKLIGALLKNLNITDRTYLSYFEMGEQLLYKEGKISKCSKASNYILAKLDFKKIQFKRKMNYKFVYEYAKEKNIKFLFDYDNSITPLCVPIMLNNRNKVRKDLMGQNIFLPVHWPISKFSAPSSFAKYLAENELSLVIDQRYSEEQITYQMDHLIKYL